MYLFVYQLNFSPVSKNTKKYFRSLPATIRTELAVSSEGPESLSYSSRLQLGPTEGSTKGPCSKLRILFNKSFQVMKDSICYCVFLTVLPTLATLTSSLESHYTIDHSKKKDGGMLILPRSCSKSRFNMFKLASRAPKLARI